MYLYYYVLAIIYKIALDYCYASYIVPQFYYFDISFNMNVSILNYLMSWLLYIILVIVSPNKIKKISDFFITLALFIMFTPLVTMYGLDEDLSFSPVIISFFCLLLIRFSVKIKPFRDKNKTSIIKDGPQLMKCLSWVMIIYLILWYFITGAVSNFNIDLRSVYEYREVNSRLTNFFIFSYINNWTIRVFILALMSYMVYKKRYGLFVILYCIQFFFFGVSSHKALLFTPFVVIGVYQFIKRVKYTYIYPLILIGIICFGLIVYDINDNFALFSSIILRRTFFVPASLTYTYFDYFSVNPFSKWGHTYFFNFLFTPEYPDKIPYIIGESLASTSMHANSGFIGSGYGEAGIFGVLIYTVIIIILLRFLNKIPQSTGHFNFCVSLLATPFIAILISGDLLEILLPSHGLIVLIFLLLLTKVSRNKQL